MIPSPIQWFQFVFMPCPEPNSEDPTPMFTGIVQSKAKIIDATTTATGKRLTVERGLTCAVHHGDSICVSGVCLTAVAITDESLSFDVIHETLLKTSIGQLSAGDAVNLEPAVTPIQPMGGHFMQGHVDGLAVVDAIHTDGGEWRITLKPDSGPADLMDYIVPRGSVAIDGVSLTLARVSDDSFDVALIPATLEMTTLGARQPGDRVNIEADILAKTIVHQMQRMRGKPRETQAVTTDLLRDAGFID
ncbi:MAG: riboflavin synthase [Phycisphaeraceae bacterium]